MMYIFLNYGDFPSNISVFLILTNLNYLSFLATIELSMDLKRASIEVLVTNSAFKVSESWIFKSLFGVSPRIALIFWSLSDFSNSKVDRWRIHEVLF